MLKVGAFGKFHFGIPFRPYEWKWRGGGLLSGLYYDEGPLFEKCVINMRLFCFIFNLKFMFTNPYTEHKEKGYKRTLLVEIDYYYCPYKYINKAKYLRILNRDTSQTLPITEESCYGK